VDLGVAYIGGILRPFPYTSSFPTPAYSLLSPRVAPRSQGGGEGEDKSALKGEPMIAFLLRDVQKRIS
jgi:hypothetical protein